MTREEAIKQLKSLLAHCERMWSKDDSIFESDCEALKIALSALRPVTREQSVVEQIVDSQPILTPQWISVEESLPKAEQEVLVACKTRTFGYRYQCQGFYVPRGIYREDSELTWDYEACDEYDEERDDYLVNEGWYERIHNWDEYGAVSISDIVTHWMPLPEPPEAPHE